MAIRPRDGYLQIDIRTRGPDGQTIRKRLRSPVQTPTGALRWAKALEHSLITNGDKEPEAKAPLLRDFHETWIKDYARANKQKASTIDAKERILRLHLLPVLGATRIDAIGAAEVQRVKVHMGKAESKTVACVLSVLSTLLRCAEEWKLIDRAPKIKMPRGLHRPEMSFYTFEEYDLLREGARRVGPAVFAFVLLGAEAGLRRGELVALEQADVIGAEVVVRRSEWKGIVGLPKGGKIRRVPMTARLAEAVSVLAHLRGKRLLWQANGRPVKVPTLQSWMETATRRAGLPPSRDIHKLRHTFISHLAMRGAPARAIQELAGHADLATTMRYMHLSPAAKDSAIRLLEQMPPSAAREMNR